MKYIFRHISGDEDNKEFNNKEEAIEYADYIWRLLTETEKKKCEAFYVLESVNPDEEAENHYDGDWVKIYKDRNGFNIDRIKKLQEEFDEECEEIAAECEAEGYPSHGSNYELRVDDLKESDYYAPLFREDYFS